MTQQIKWQSGIRLLDASFARRNDGPYPDIRAALLGV